MSPFCKKLSLVGLLCPHKAKGLMKVLVKEIALELGGGNWIARMKEFGYESFSSSHLRLSGLAIRDIKVLGGLMSYKPCIWLKFSNLLLSQNPVSTDMGIFHKQRISSSCEASLLSIQLRACLVKKQLLHKTTVEIIHKKNITLLQRLKSLWVFKLHYAVRITLKYPFRKRLLGHRRTQDS